VGASVRVEYVDADARSLCEGSQTVPTSTGPMTARVLRRRIETLAAAVSVDDLRALKSFGLREYPASNSRVTVNGELTLTIHLDDGPPPIAVVQSVLPIAI
jgi:plasmid maintenance system killer protein